MDWIKKYKPQLVDEFVNDDEFENVLAKWMKKCGESDKSKKDFLWHVFQKLNKAIAEKFGVSIEMYQYQRKLYCIMFSFLIDEKRNRSHIFKSINHCDLMIADLSDFRQEVEFIANKCCEECDKIDGTTTSLEEAIKKRPLPYNKCKRKYGCICCYGFKAVRDAGGRLVKKD